MFEAALKAASPTRRLPEHLPAPPIGRTVVIGAGKAAASMALEVEKHWQGAISGVVVTRYGHGAPCKKIEVIEASHPLPDHAGQQAAHQILNMISDLSGDDLVLCLISGGGSALLTQPISGLSLQDKQMVNQALLRCGANIAEINCVRKHLSAIKGGRLAVAASPARVLTLMISDVPGDDPSVIASGPTVPDPSTCEDALCILDKYQIQAPNSVIEILKSGLGETPKPGDSCFQNTDNIIIARPQDALDAAAEVARDQLYYPLVLGDIEGEAKDVGLVHAGIAKQIVNFSQPVSSPCVIISGGETTVTVRGDGRGGRNAEFLLSLTIALNGHSKIHALAADTDGIDGSEDNAGCFITPDSLSVARLSNLDPKTYLANNDAYTFFQTIDGLVKTGPTLTNVNDFRAILINE